MASECCQQRFNCSSSQLTAASLLITIMNSNLKFKSILFEANDVTMLSLSYVIAIPSLICLLSVRDICAPYSVVELFGKIFLQHLTA